MPDPEAGLLDSAKILVLPILVLSLDEIGYLARMTRVSMAEVMHSDYIRTAVLKGIPQRLVIWRDALCNALIMAIGALGFLGLGIPPPTPDWGGMINEGRHWIFAMPWTVLAPAIALSSMVVGLNLLADGMRENAQSR